ncbi:MAG: MFS transporter [Promethearchaeota archaeon]
MRFEIKDKLSEHDIESGLQYFMKDALATQTMTTLTTSTFLVAFALLLGASNFIIGLLAAIPFLTQLVQIPGIYLIEKYQTRRAIYVYAATASRVFILGLVFIAFLAPFFGVLILLILAQLFRATFAAISTCSWNSWMHDIVPKDRLGVFFSKRMTLATMLAIPLGLVSGIFIQYWDLVNPDTVLVAFAIIFLLGFFAGLLGVYLISSIAEPKMHISTENLRFHRRLQAPFDDANFKNLIYFLVVLNFAVNLAAPFFTVYMLVVLQLPILLVIIFTIINQITSLAFLRIWGRLSDQMSNKSVLTISGIILLFCILGFTFTTLPTYHALSLTLLIIIHIFIGISTAGVSLSSGNITIKLAPEGKGTTYLAAASISNSLAAGLAPIFGGIIADLFIFTEFSLILTWISPISGFIIPLFSLRYYDFLFLFAFFIGLYAIHRLAYVKEVGETKRREVLHALVSEVRNSTRSLSFLRGLRNLFHIPYETTPLLEKSESNNETDNQSTEEKR